MEQEPDVKLLVWANKQDLPNSMSAAEITTLLLTPTPAIDVPVSWQHPNGVIPATEGMEALLGPIGERWYVQPCSATTGEGLYEGLDWCRVALAV